jgi:hypothetical protein
MNYNFKGLVGITLVLCSGCITQVKSEDINQGLKNNSSKLQKLIQKPELEPIIENEMETKVSKVVSDKLIPKSVAEVTSKNETEETPENIPEITFSFNRYSCPKVNDFSANSCVGKLGQPPIIEEDNYSIREILMMILASISIISIFVNVGIWRRDKKNSIEELFWIRDILMPDLNKAFKHFQHSAQTAPKKDLKKFESYYAKDMAPKRLALIGILHSIKLVHPPLFKTLNKVIFSVDDVFYTDIGGLQSSTVYMRDISYVWSSICESIYKYQKSK